VIPIRSQQSLIFKPAEGRKTVQTTKGEIFVVDDDPAVCETLSILLADAGYQVTCFGDGASLLAITRTRSPFCVLLDMYLPGRSGLDILSDLQAQEFTAPTFMISGQGDIATAVTAIKNGAFDFIEKPFHGRQLVTQIEVAIGAMKRLQDDRSPRRLPKFHFPGRAPLTAREREVLSQLTAGASNKEIGIHLGISSRTVEYHRANLMTKLGAKNAVELVRMALADVETTE
jgi:FixJ family two-component response regulator